MNCDRHCSTQKTPGTAISDRDPGPLRADLKEPASYHQYRKQIRFHKPTTYHMSRSIDRHECKSPIFLWVPGSCEYLLVTSRFPRCAVNSRKPRLQILRSKPSLSIPAHGIEPAKIPRCITGQIQISVVHQHVDAIFKCKLDLVHSGLVKVIAGLECGRYLF